MIPSTTGRQVSFHGLHIRYDERVLAPRAWTAAQSLWAAEVIAVAEPGPVLELCAGVGHIGLLAVHLAPRPLVCVDANPAACELLEDNARAAGIPVDIREATLDRALAPDERFPVIIADPPWVTRDRVADFPEDPVTAIDGGLDGLDLVRACLEVIGSHLTDAGVALLQTGPTQVDAVSELASPFALRVTDARVYERGAVVRLDRSEQ